MLVASQKWKTKKRTKQASAQLEFKSLKKILSIFKGKG